MDSQSRKVEDEAVDYKMIAPTYLFPEILKIIPHPQGEITMHNFMQKNLI